MSDTQPAAAAPDDAAADGSPVSPVDHPALHALIHLRQTGDVLRAQQGFDRVAEALERLPASQDAAAEALWLDATRHWFESALESDQIDLALSGLRKRFERFQTPTWTALREKTAQCYHDMIELSIATNLDEQAFELYEKIRGQIPLPSDLRVKLLEVAHRLDRFDPATARLCIEELTAGSPPPPQQAERLFEILRHALRVTLDTPTVELLSEYRALNLQVWETVHRAWAVGHLAAADWRLNRQADARRWCQQRRTKEDPAETDLLVGSVAYLLHDWNIARERFQAAIEKPAPELRSMAQGLRQLERLNAVLEQRGYGRAREKFQHAVDVGLRELNGWEERDGFQLDADWVVGTASAVLEQFEAARQYFQRAPAELARWRHASTAWEVLRAAVSADQLAEWLGKLRAHRPALAQCLDARRLISEQQFDSAGRLLAGVASVHSDSLDQDAELAAAVTCLKFELALAGAEQTPPTPENLPPAFREWSDQLELRRLVERGCLDQARELRSKTTQHTAEPQRWARVRAVLAAAGLKTPEESGIRLQQLANSSAAEPLDKLHLGLWLVGQQQPDEAEPLLEKFAQEFPECIECQLALARCRLLQGSTEDAQQRLLSVAGLVSFRNRVRWAWFRPWANLIPVERDTDQALVARPRLADVLYATDLALNASQPALAQDLLSQFEHLLGPQAENFADKVGARLNQVAMQQAQAGDWEAACGAHQAARKHGCRDDQFVEILARSHESAATATDTVLEVLFAWAVEFTGEEDAFLESPIGNTLAALVRIEMPTADGQLEFEHRFRWSTRLHQARSGWDDPKRSLLRGHSRLHEDQEVIALGLSLQSPTAADFRLLARALWNVGRFQEAASAFAAGGEIAWGGCAQAADLFQAMARNETWLSAEQVQPVLEALSADAGDAERPPHVSMWTGAVLTACGRGKEALSHLKAAAVGDAEAEADRRLLMGVAHLLAGDADAAEATWASPEPLEALLEAPERLLNWDRTAAGLWLLSRLQRPGERELTRLGQLVRQFRKLGEDSELFRINVAELALRLGDIDAARSAAESLARRDTLVPREILRAPLQCLRRGERDFIAARIQMQNAEHNEAEQSFTRSALEPLWPHRSRYWKALCRIHLQDLAGAEPLLIQLQADCPNDPAIPAQCAQLRLVRGDIQGAAALVESALQIDGEHGFSLLVHAEVQERVTGADAARNVLSRLVELPQWQVNRRVRAAAAMALGRLAFDRGEPRAALKHFRTAESWSGHGLDAVRRVGIVLAACAQSPDELREADALLAEAHQAAAHDLFVGMARVITADELGNVNSVAERLEHLVSLPAFGTLPANARRELAVLSASTQLRQKRFRAAASAFEQLLAEAPDEHLAEQLRRCRLMQALQVLSERPLPGDAFEQIRTAAESVCAGPQPPPVAPLLKVLGQLFTKQCETEDARKQAQAEAASAAAADPTLAWLAAIVRFWLGDETAKAELADLWQREGADLQRLVETVAANLKRQPAGLKAEAQRLAATTDGVTAFDPEDMIVISALATAGSKPDEGAELLRQWHRHREASQRTRLLLSQLLAKQAVKSLKQKKMNLTRQLLSESLAAIEL